MSRDLLYEKLIRPVLFCLDPESVHNLAAAGLSIARPLLPGMGFIYKENDLQTELFGTMVANPIGLAAGFDKNARLAPLLGSLGFGFAEIGSICARPHGGNSRPRIFRLPCDRALINSMGLNGLGAEFVAKNLSRLNLSCLPVGVNIAKTNDKSLTGADAVADMVYSFKCIRDLAVKFVTINTSCPNTAEGCLTESRQLERVLEGIAQENHAGLPVLIKLSCDSTDEFLQEVVNLSRRFKAAGFVCGNTTVKRDRLQTAKAELEKIGAGGLSGRPLKPLNLALTQKVAGMKEAEQIIIGAGGIESGEDLFEYLSAGARLVQLYTGFVYRGPAAVRLICQELSQILKSKGMTLAQLYGQRPGF